MSRLLYINLTSKPEWMNLIYKIGVVLLQACTVDKGIIDSYEENTFMTFNPYAKDGVVERYKTSRQVGHYWSQMTCVNEYAMAFTRVEESAHSNSALNNMLFIDTVFHAICFDFCAWSAQLLGYYQANSTKELEDMLRLELIKDINSIRNDIFSSYGIKEMFLYIARLIRPAKDNIKCALTSHITKTVDDIRAARRFNSHSSVDVTSLSTVRGPLINIDYYPHHTDDSFYFEETLQGTSSPPLHHRSHLDSEDDGYDSEKEALSYDKVPSDDDQHLKSKHSSYVETPTYQPTRTIVDYEEYCNNNPKNLTTRQYAQMQEDKANAQKNDENDQDNNSLTDNSVTDIVEEDTLDSRMRRFVHEYSDDDDNYPNATEDEKEVRRRDAWNNDHNQPPKRPIDEVEGLIDGTLPPNKKIRELVLPLQDVPSSPVTRPDP